MGFDPITMAATISKLQNSGRIGHDGKTEKTYTFDGVVGDRPNANGLVFISSDTPDINSIKSVGTIFNGQQMTVTKEELTIQDKNTDMDGIFAAAYYGEYPAVYINFSEVGVPPGLYVLCGDENNFVSSVTFESGEVKTIDPKYLYPHFDLAAMGLPSVVPGGEEARLELTNSEELRQAMLGGVIKVTLNLNVGADVSVTTTLPCSYAAADNSMQGSTIAFFTNSVLMVYVALMANGTLSCGVKLIATS